MRQSLIPWLCLCGLLAAGSAEAGAGRVAKVLPHFLDAQGRHALSPSLYERDAYQAMLRQHPEKRSGIRFDVQWKGKGPFWEPLKVIVELRGIAQGALPKETVLEKRVEPPGWLGSWSQIALEGEAYRNFGEVTAWRVSLWEGQRLLGERKSFLW